MKKPSVILEKERDFTDLMNGTFAFIGQEYKLLLKTVCFYAGILILLSVIVNACYVDMAIGDMFQTLVRGGGYSDIVAQNWIFVFLLYATQLLTQFLIWGLVCAYMTVYRDRGHGNFEAADVWTAFAGKLPLALGVSVAVFLMICAGMIFCFIPGIYLIVPLSLTLMVLYAEKSDFGEVIGRAFKLTSGHWWFTFGFFIVVGLIVGVISYVFSLPATVIGIIQAVTLVSESSDALVNGMNNSPAIIVTSVVSGIGSYLLTPVVYIATGLQYFNLKEKKDKTSLFRKVSEISSTIKE